MRNLILILSFFLFATLKMLAQEGIALNEKAPLFAAQDQNNETFDLAKELENNKVVIVFYRGQWCPYCNRHMSALQDSLHLINAKGARVIAITPEKSEEIDKSVEKSGAKFSIIYDQDHKIMDAYDVTFTMSKSKHVAYLAYGININEASGNDDRALPVPATFVISKEGIVTHRHFDKNYKTRMTVKEILEVL